MKGCLIGWMVYGNKTSRESSNNALPGSKGAESTFRRMAEILTS